MITRNTVVSDAIQAEKGQPGWHQHLVQMLRAYTGNLRILSFEHICSNLRKTEPGITEADIRDVLQVLKQRGAVGERSGALGGSYWFSMDESRRQLAAPPRKQAPYRLEPPRNVEPGVLPAGGDISEVFRGAALKELVLMVFKSKGYVVPTRPGTAYAGVTVDAWAELQDGRVIVAECVGLDETLKAATVWDFAARVRKVIWQAGEGQVEPWLICMGRVTPDIERICVDLALKRVQPLELIGEAMYQGILGIGWRCMRPYVARIGEPGVFLGPDKSGRAGIQQGGSHET